jgi:RNA polymerase sigma-70 factor (ECF subfamily)
MASAAPMPSLRLESIMRSARSSLLTLVRRVVDHAEAEDVVQEAFVRLTNDPVLARPDGEITAWLRRTSLNLAFNRARDVGRWRARAERAETSEAADPADEAIRSEERAMVRAVLDELPEKQRSCLLLRHAGYSYLEIAATLDIAPGSVGTTLARAERAFKDHYLQAHPRHDQGEDNDSDDLS